jgi:hypothetical protein
MNEINKQTIDLLLSYENINTSRLLLKRSLKHFIAVFHFYLTGKQFIFKKFHKEIIKELELVVFGEAEKKNLIINIVPRFGKSAIAQYFTAWSFALNLSSNFIYTSYSDNLVLSFSDKIKDIIESDLFKKLYNLSLSDSESSKRKWSIDGGGGLYASSQGGSITGFGSGVISDEYGGALIIDDVIKPEDAKSEVMRQKAISYFNETLSNRLNNPKKTPIIIIMQRLHLDDLCGYLTREDKDNWKVLCYPAYNEETKESIWEEKYNSEFFEKLKRQNPFYYYSQFR